MEQVYVVCMLLAVVGVPATYGISCYDCSYRAVNDVAQTDTTNNVVYTSECGFPSGVNTSLIPTTECAGSCYIISGTVDATQCTRRGCYNSTSGCTEGASYTWNCGSVSVTGTTHCCTGDKCNTAGHFSVGLAVWVFMVISLFFKS